MPVVFIPTPMRDLTGGEPRVTVEGEFVRDVIDALDRQYPGIKDRLCHGDALAPGLTVCIDDTVSRRGLNARVTVQSEVHFLPPIGGG